MSHPPLKNFILIKILIMKKFRHYVIRQDHISSSQFWAVPSSQLWQCAHLPPQAAAFLHKSHHAQSRRNNQQVMDLCTRASSWGVRSGGGQFLSFSSDTAAIRGCCGSNLRRDGGRGDTTRRHNNQQARMEWSRGDQRFRFGG